MHRMSILVMILILSALFCACQTSNTVPALEAGLAAPSAGDEGVPAPTPDIVEDKNVTAPSTMTEATGKTPPPAEKPGLALSNEQRFSDVPLPAKLKEDSEHSYVFESDTLQIGKMVYKTKASVNELAQFYIRECPAADWKLESMLQSDGVYMVFIKPGKRLIVSVEEKHGVHPHRVLTLNFTPDPGSKAAP